MKESFMEDSPKDELVSPVSLFYELLDNKGYLFCLNIGSDLGEPAQVQKRCPLQRAINIFLCS